MNSPLASFFSSNHPGTKSAAHPSSIDPTINFEQTGSEQDATLESFANALAILDDLPEMENVVTPGPSVARKLKTSPVTNVTLINSDWASSSNQSLTTPDDQPFPASNLSLPVDVTQTSNQSYKSTVFLAIQDRVTQKLPGYSSRTTDQQSPFANASSRSNHIAPTSNSIGGNSDSTFNSSTKQRNKATTTPEAATTQSKVQLQIPSSGTHHHIQEKDDQMASENVPNIETNQILQFINDGNEATNSPQSSNISTETGSTKVSTSHATNSLISQLIEDSANRETSVMESNEKLGTPSKQIELAKNQSKPNQNHPKPEQLRFKLEHNRPIANENHHEPTQSDTLIPEPVVVSDNADYEKLQSKQNKFQASPTKRDLGELNSDTPPKPNTSILAGEASSELVAIPLNPPPKAQKPLSQTASSKKNDVADVSDSSKPEMQTTDIESRVRQPPPETTIHATSTHQPSRLSLDSVIQATTQSQTSNHVVTNSMNTRKESLANNKPNASDTEVTTHPEHELGHTKNRLQASPLNKFSDEPTNFASATNLDFAQNVEPIETYYSPKPIEAQHVADQTQTTVGVTDLNAMLPSGSDLKYFATVNHTHDHGALMQGVAENATAQVTEAFKTKFVPLTTETTQSISLELNPPELGHLQISVEQSSDAIVAQIVASEFASTEMLLQEKHLLLEALSEIGSGETTIDISHRDSNREQPDTRRGNNSYHPDSEPEIVPHGDQFTNTQTVGINLIA